MATAKNWISNSLPKGKTHNIKQGLWIIDIMGLALVCLPANLTNAGEPGGPNAETRAPASAQAGWGRSAPPHDASLVPQRHTLAIITMPADKPTNRIYILQRETLHWSMTAWQTGGRMGTAVAGGADLNGDGQPDLVIGGRTRGSASRRNAVVDWLSYSGATREFRFATLLNDSDVTDGLAQCALALGDFNRDGFADLLLGDFQFSTRGRVVLFLGADNGLKPAAGVKRAPGDTLDFGFSVANVGDVNGDGYADAVIGLPRASVPFRQYDGAASLHLGGPAGLSTNAVWQHRGGRFNRRLGYCVAGAGDVNGDGFADVLIGVPFAEKDAEPRAGRACLFLGSKTGLRDTADWVWKGTLPGGMAGWSVAGLGDVNGDGFADFSVSAPGYNVRTKATNITASSLVAVFLGGSNGPPATPNLTLESDTPESRFGAAVAGVGDLNRDGFADVVIGAPDYMVKHSQEGRASVYLGSSNGLVAEAVWTIDGGTPTAQCGYSVCATGDLNGDGYADFALGSPGYDGISHNEGRVDVFFGSTSNYVRVPADLNRPVTAPAAAPPPRRPLGVAVVATLALSALAFGLVLLRQRREARRRAREERERIARDLHDDIGARLAALNLLMQSGARGGAGDANDHEHQEAVARAAHETIEAIEHIIWAVKPMNDTLENLITFITQYAAPFLAPAGIRCSYEAPISAPEVVLPPDFRKNIFLTLKEALNNIVKHAHATEVQLRIQLEHRTLRLAIADDGRGLPESAGRTSHGEEDGIANMRRRMADVGGSFRIGPRPGGGTEVELSAPIP